MRDIIPESGGSTFLQRTPSVPPPWRLPPDASLYRWWRWRGGRAACRNREPVKPLADSLIESVVTVTVNLFGK